MGKKDPKVDAYIAKSKPFAQPILKYLRQVIHSVTFDIRTKRDAADMPVPMEEVRGRNV